MPHVAFALFLTLLLPVALVAEPVPFELHYTTRFNNLQADAVRILEPLPSPSGWQFTTSIDLKLLNASLSRIVERSEFEWQEAGPVSRRYEFNQSGMGSRQRSLVFDAARVVFTNNETRGEHALTEPTYDVLNMVLAVSQRVKANQRVLEFTVAERSELNLHRYEVIGPERLQLAIGSFDSIHVRRVRPPGDDRETDLWFSALSTDVLLKLVQQEPGGDALSMELRDGKVAGEAVSTLQVSSEGIKNEPLSAGKGAAESAEAVAPTTASPSPAR
jgi:hypothetical protein